MGKYTMKLFDCKSVRLWEKPLATSINRLRSRSTLFPFPDEQQAKKVSFEPFDCPQIMNLNGEWKFRCLACPEQVEEAFTGERFDDSGWDDIAVPLNWYLKYPEKQTTVTPYVRGYYRTSFDLMPEELQNRRVLLNFDVVGYDADVFLNGVRIGGHHGDFTPFRLDATEAAKAGKNVLAVRVFSDNGPTFGVQRKVDRTYGSQWAIHNIKGGIWQDVTLSLEPQLRAERLTVTPDLASSSVSVDCRVVNPGSRPVTVSAAGRAVSAMKREAGAVAGETSLAGLTLKPGVNDFTLTVPLKNPRRWGVASPYLYDFLLTLAGEDGEIISAAAARFGFREFRIADGRFLLNGEPIYLFGENIPAVDYGGTGASAAEMERKLEAFLLGYLNHGYVMVRNAHMPIVPKALEIADECGIMIYNEWSWCFTNSIEPDAFARVNSQELEEFFHATGNHPSVTMWSLGNEVVHSNRPEIARQMDLQVETVRAMDRQKRPISTFSGQAGWGSYGRTKLDTDVYDLHTYVALSRPWTERDKEADFIYKGLLEIFGGKNGRLEKPLIAWENVGFSWGFHDASNKNANFKRNDIDEYMKYVNREYNWGQPCGIGFTGCMSLAEAVDPAVRQDVPMSRYGRRIFELYRLDRRFTGFAPWFSDPTLKTATLWNQPVLPTLRNPAGLPPRNLFSGGTTAWNLEIVNNSNRAYRSLTLEVALAGPDGKTVPVASLPAGELPAQRNAKREVQLTMPETGTGFYQLRLTLLDNGKELARNYYDLYIDTPALRSEKIEAVRPVLVYDTGAPKNVARLAEQLKAFGMPYTVVRDLKTLKAPATLVIPPETETPQRLSLRNDPNLSAFLNAGGVVLLLEQKNLSSELPLGLQLVADEKSFCDPVILTHPVFEGLSARNFDTWNNPDFGYVVSSCFLPFTENALAAKGPNLGSRNVGMALLEGTVGKGRLIVSQLNAFAAAPQDSSAARYLRNLFRYAAGTAELRKEARPMVSSADTGYKVNPARLEPVDLAPYANRGFSDEFDNDGKGGWFDQGENDFRMMPTGAVEAAGVAFRIIDPAENNDKSCLVLAGTDRPKFPLSIRGIKVNRKFSRLYFLHTAAWGGKGKAGAYRINFADGTHLDYPIEGNQNIGDWWTVAQLPAAKIGILRKNAMDHEVGTFVAEWENPKPDVEIKSIDFLSATEARGNEIDWLPSGTPIPVLVAVTGEKVSDKLLDITGSRFVRAAGLMEHGSTVPAEVKTVKTGSGVQLDISFKASPPKEIPAVLISYDKKDAAADYRYLTFQAKSPEEAVIQVVLPREDWQARLRGDVTLKGDNHWHKYRLMVGRNFENENGFSFDKQRGELFLYYRSLRAPDTARPALNFEIKDITLE